MRRSWVLVAALALGACSDGPPKLSVDKAYIRLAAVPSRPAVAYFTIHGGTADTALIAVSSEVSVKNELHESMQSGGLSAMKPVGDVPIRSGSTVVFAPGGKHLMLFDMNPGIKPGRAVTLTFTFANNQRIAFDAPTIAAGAPAPAP
ncbi:copper chaperone PCu(A)C [Sphingomonas glacialis]|uniref:Copper chaperone PCu(A)C n=1 Tax=Sphingomonas glacialis TaxID=658225 RepID=A0A502FY13_9SPHN|nr:copper chaperone PCu(A)C [Sphingomonas glacialis]TPG54415.1 copper chaperone PCu(A)C [Sphingomonas glacialis]